MSNRILDYPEATGITSDDYILLDNEGTGAKCIKASALNINMDNYTIKEARGSIASFDDGEDLPLAFLGAYITAIQEGSGDPSPTNIRPISGFSGVEVVDCGKNLFIEDNFIEAYPTKYTKATDGSIETVGTLQNGDVLWQNIKGYSGDLTISFKYKYASTGSVGIRPIIYYTDGTSSTLYTTNSQSYNTITSTLASGGKIIDKIVTDYGTSGNKTNFYLQVEKGIIATEIEYNNFHTYSLIFTDAQGNPIKVYGGYSELICGGLVVNRGHVDMGDINWSYDGNGIFYVNNLSGLKVNGDAISSAYATTKSYPTVMSTNGTLWVSDARNQLVVHNNAYTSASDFKTAMQGQKIVYELATPLTYQLSKQQIKSLVGENNIFADTGDVIVDYRKLWVKPEM